jgi:hypothetical protein
MLDQLLNYTGYHKKPENKLLSNDKHTINDVSICKITSPGFCWFLLLITLD